MKEMQGKTFTLSDCINSTRDNTSTEGKHDFHAVLKAYQLM
jgi:hypothetical protein